MSRPRSRRSLLTLCGTAFCLGAGCLGDAASEAPASESTRTNATATERLTVSPSEVSDEEARDRALAAEEEFLTARLENASCLNGWGTTPATVDESAAVVDRSADGVTVSVTHPYWYSTDRAEADLASEAVYVVTEDEARRVGDGEDVSPC